MRVIPLEFEPRQNGRPRVIKASVDVRGWWVLNRVQFVVDTGSHRTILGPIEWTIVNQIWNGSFPYPDPANANGIAVMAPPSDQFGTMGGTADLKRGPNAEITLYLAAGTYHINLDTIWFSPHENVTPVLGMDALDKGKLVVEGASHDMLTNGGQPRGVLVYA